MNKGPLRWLGSLFFFYILFWLSAISMEGTKYLDVPSALLVVAGGLALPVSAHGLSCIPLTFKALFGNLDPSEIELAHTVAGTFRKAFIASAWLGVLLGHFQAATQGIHSDTVRTIVDYSNLNAVLFAPLLYGYVTAWLIFLPLERGLAEPQPPSRPS